MRKISLIAFLLLLPFFVSATYDDTVTTDKNYQIIQTGEFFSAYKVPLTSYVYDESAGVAFTSGQIPPSGSTPSVLFFTIKTITFNISLDDATSIDVRIEGRSASNTATWAEVYSHSFTSSTTIDFVVPVQEQWSYLRCGAKRSGGTGAANNLISCYFDLRNNQ